MKIKPITVAGLFLAIFGILLVQIILQFTPLANKLSDQNLVILGLMFIWLLGFGLLVIVKSGEKQSLTSIGYKAINGKEILLAVIIGIALSLLVPVLTLLVSQIIPSSGGGIEAVTANNPWWVILFSIITAGIMEELIFRGYIIERLFKLTNKYWIAVSVSIIAFLLPHTFSWNSTHVIAVVLPLGLILSGLYVWKRNLIFNMIVHVVIDLPLVVLALMPN